MDSNLKPETNIMKHGYWLQLQPLETFYFLYPKKYFNDETNKATLTKE